FSAYKLLRSKDGGTVLSFTFLSSLRSFNVGDCILDVRRIAHQRFPETMGDERAPDVPACTCQPERDVASMRLVRQTFDHVGAGRVEERHLGEVNDQRLVGVLDTVENRTDRSRRAEEQRPADAVDDDIWVR